MLANPQVRGLVGGGAPGDRTQTPRIRSECGLTGRPEVYRANTHVAGLTSGSCAGQAARLYSLIRPERILRRRIGPSIGTAAAASPRQPDPPAHINRPNRDPPDTRRGKAG